MITVEHAHSWGPSQEARLTGVPYRKCTLEGCHFINALDDDDESDMDESITVWVRTISQGGTE